MDILAAIVCWGWLWTLLLWRAIASYSIYKEVIEKKTTRDAILFLVMQGGIYLFVAIIYIRASEFNFSNTITFLMFTAAGMAHLVLGIKSLMV